MVTWKIIVGKKFVRKMCKITNTNESFIICVNNQQIYLKNVLNNNSKVFFCKKLIKNVVKKHLQRENVVSVWIIFFSVAAKEVSFQEIVWKKRTVKVKHVFATKVSFKYRDKKILSQQLFKMKLWLLEGLILSSFLKKVLFQRILAKITRICLKSKKCFRYEG